MTSEVIAKVHAKRKHRGLVSTANAAATSMASPMFSTQTAAARLNTFLWIDAVGVVAFGVVFALGAEALSAHVGLSAVVLRAIGLVMLPFAALIAWITVRGASSAGVWFVIVANSLWVVGWLALVALGVLATTTLGVAFLLGQAAAGALVTGLEFVALRQRESVAA
jgi:hypothetical protein